MVSLLAALLALCAGAAVAATDVCPDSDTVCRIDVASPHRYWPNHGFAEMVPALHLPTTHDVSDMIHVYLHVPEGSRIGSRYLADQSRTTLVFPAGTEMVRVETVRYGGRDPGTDESVVDVRGTRVGTQGPRRFFVLRPADGSAQAPLQGWSWPADDALAARVATSRLLQMTAGAGTPIGRPPLDADGLTALGRLNDCVQCHIPNHRREQTVKHAPMPRRETDASGFYVPLSVLHDEAPLAATRPLDINAGDAYVSVRCSDAPAMLMREEGWIWYRCADGGVPVGRRDVRAGIADADPYTQAVCASRRYLYDHMDEPTRNAFAPALAACAQGSD